MKPIRLRNLIWPIFIDASFHIMMGNIDTIMLSNYSENAVAAVGMSTQITTIIIIILEFVAIGAGIVIAQMLGANRKKDAISLAQSSMYLNATLGLLLSLLLFFASSNIVSIFNLTNQSIDFANQYLSIVSFSFIFEAVIFSLSIIMRSYGYAKEPMFVVVFMVLINIIGNSLLLYGYFNLPQLGVAGVAISTLISKFIAMVLILLLYKKKVGFIHFKVNFLNDAVAIIKVGIPTAGERFSYDLSQILITYFITFLGVVAVTTKIITHNVMLLIMIFSYSVGQATQVLIGHLIGAGENNTAYQRGLSSLKLAVIASFFIAICIFLLSEPILSLFTENKTVVRTGQNLLMLSIILEPGRAFNFVLSSALKATGDIKFPTFLGILSMWFLCVPLAILLGNIFNLGLVGVWIAFSVDEWLRGLVLLIRWRSKLWINKKIVFKDNNEVKAIL